MHNSANHGIFTTGGTVQAGHGIYLSRRADEELLALCRSGTVAYVLTPRQMGKSSLMVQTAQRLADEGVQSVVVDLTQIGTGVDAEQWYLGILTLIEEQLLLETDVMDWWRSQAHLGVTQRLTQFFRQVVLAEVDGPIVVFIDEIDTTLRLDFTDDFFAAIRFLYTERSRLPELGRLSFVLIGVATPGDLIRDAKRTPFNVGTRVDLTDFTLAEARPLAAGLGVPELERQAVLERVLEWTGGHPYLTQRLCEAIVQAGDGPWDGAAVGEIVQQTFLGEQSDRDNNLQFVRDMLTKRAPEEGQDAVLRAYREVWRGRKVADEEHSLIKSHLKLSGVVKKVGQRLRLRNRIYQRVFDGKWIRENLSESWLQRYWPVLRVAVPVSAISLVVAGVMVGLAREAEMQKTVAEIREGAARAKYWLSTENAALGLALAIATTDRSQRSQPIAQNATLVAASDSLLLGLQTAQEQNRLTGHSAYVRSVAFSPDGKRIVSGSADKTLRLWDAVTGQPIGQPLTGHSDSVRSVAFSPDGKRIVSGSWDNTLRLWDGDWSGWMRLACNRLQYHPLLNAPKTILSSEDLIQTGKNAKAACDSRPWEKATPAMRKVSWWAQAVKWVAGVFRF